MIRFVIAAALALGGFAGAPAGATGTVPAGNAQAQPVRMANVAAAPAVPSFLDTRMSELPEPEVFAMMLVGLVLIGWRASRDSSEKFK